MLRFHSLFLTLAALILIVQPAASHPIRTPKWIKINEFEDSQSRGIWKVFQKDAITPGPELPRPVHSQTPLQPDNHDDPTLERGPPGRHYKRDSSSGKSIVSVLVPVRASSSQSHYHHHYSQGEPKDSYPRLKSNTAHKTKHYGEILGQSQRQGNALHDKESTTATTFSTASLKLASGQSISFFSYRITLPFLNFASSSFPHFQFPGIFTTVMVLLAMVWVAIVMIGLVEFGNYLWKRRRMAGLADESDQERSGEAGAESLEMVKAPLRVVVGSSGTSRGVYHEDSTLLSSASASEDGSESTRDDYRF